MVLAFVFEHRLSIRARLRMQLGNQISNVAVFLWRPHEGEPRNEIFDPGYVSVTVDSDIGTALTTDCLI